jgi:formate hydrogenlyase subunit 6/NADH:ubiquinone oxidoreductase subunit I
MKIGAMLGDIFGSLFKKPATQMYPYVKTEGPTRLRGQLVYDATKCTGCQLCVKDCPADAIEIITVDKVNKKFVMRYHSDRCTFCAQCVETCKFACLAMSNTDWELAAASREPFEVTYGREEDVAFILERAAHPEPADVQG